MERAIWRHEIVFAVTVIRLITLVGWGAERMVADVLLLTHFWSR
jgi:hypothetical protein